MGSLPVRPLVDRLDRTEGSAQLRAEHADPLLALREKNGKQEYKREVFELLSPMLDIAKMDLTRIRKRKHRDETCLMAY